MERETIDIYCAFYAHICTKSLSVPGKPGEASPVADGSEPREGKCIQVTGVKWVGQNRKSEPGLLATTFLKSSQEKSKAQVEMTEQRLRVR